MTFEQPPEQPAVATSTDAPIPPASTHSKPRVLPVFLAAALAMVGQLVLGAALAFIIGVALFIDLQGAPNIEEQIAAALPSELLRAPWLVASVTMTATLLVVFALLIARLSPEPAALRLGLRRRGRELTTAAAAALTLATFAAVLLVSVLIALSGIEVELFEQLANAAKNATPLGFVALLVAGGVVAPVAEELFFRGAVQTRLVARFGPAVGIGVTAVLFGAFHLSPAHAAFATVVGVLLGILRHVVGTIHLAILVHVLNNLLSFGLPRISSADAQTSTVVVESAVVGVVFVAAALAFWRSTRSWLWRREDDAS